MSEARMGTPAPKPLSGFGKGVRVASSEGNMKLYSHVSAAWQAWKELKKLGQPKMQFSEFVASQKNLIQMTEKPQLPGAESAQGQSRSQVRLIPVSSTQQGGSPQRASILQKTPSLNAGKQKKHVTFKADSPALGNSKETSLPEPLDLTTPVTPSPSDPPSEASATPQSPTRRALILQRQNEARRQKLLSLKIMCHIMESKVVFLMKHEGLMKELSEEDSNKFGSILVYMKEVKEHLVAETKHLQELKESITAGKERTSISMQIFRKKQVVPVEMD